MVVNAPDSPVQAEVIFVIEATAANGAYIGELKSNYIVPTLEYFHGGPLEEGGGSGSVYSIVTYKAADCHPGIPVATFGPYTCPQTVVETVDKIQYIGGHAESRACVTEALTAALACFDELGRTDIPIHVLLLCCSPPYSAYAGGLVPAGAPATVEQAARLLADRGVQVSVASARRVPALHALYEHAGGELHQAQQRNYAKVTPVCRTARLRADRGVQVSVASARRVPALHALYEHAGGELHQAQQRNYAKVTPVCRTARLRADRGVQVSVASARRVPALHALYEHAGGELHQAQQRNYAKVTPVCRTARLRADRGVQVSVASARRVPALHALYEHAGGELHQAQQRNYAKDPRHLVLLRGYSLKERPPSPAPPPVPDIQADVYGQGRGTTGPARPGAQNFPRPGVAANAGVGPVGPGPGVPGVPGVGNPSCGRGAGNWLAPPRAPLYANNSALLTQLAQPSYPPPPPPPAHGAQGGHQRMPTMVTPGPSGAQLQRSYIWSGVIEWMEKGKAPGDQQKTTKHLPCQVSASTKDIEPELKVDTWPNKLLMQLMPKQLISNIGGQYLKDSKSVLFHLQPSEALDALTKVMVNGFAGCVHFSPMPTPPQCDIKVLILLYTPDKKAYLGFIPNNQATFVDRLRKVIQQQKISQIISKQQLPAAGGNAPGMPQNMPNAAMPGSGGMPGGAGMSSGGMGPGMAGGMQPGPGGVPGNVGSMPGPAAAQGMVQSQMQQHPQGMMIGGSIGQQVQQVGGKGPRPVTQLDGLEAARQHNLEKIQHLQQTLEAAHQQEAQFKSQMDIMSHLHAAQQQEQHYKQLEEQQRKHQLQQQLQQQLRGAAGVAHPPRAMRPLLPSNPGLRHLLQQQPQYRPGGGAPRPASQSQQFDDVNNYSDFI